MQARKESTKWLPDIAVVSRMAIEFFGLHTSEISQNPRKMVAQARHKSAKQMLRMFAQRGVRKSIARAD
jgi:hypothetical protein